MNQPKVKYSLSNWDLVTVNPNYKTWNWKDMFCFWGVNIQSVIAFSLIASLYIVYDLNTLVVFFGTILGCLFAIYVDTIFAFVNYVSGGGVWDPSIRGIYEIPAELKLDDVITAVTLSLGLSFRITYFPARRAARMNPVEALRYE